MPDLTLIYSNGSESSRQYDKTGGSLQGYWFCGEVFLYSSFSMLREFNKLLYTYCSFSSILIFLAYLCCLIRFQYVHSWICYAIEYIDVDMLTPSLKRNSKRTYQKGDRSTTAMVANEM